MKNIKEITNIKSDMVLNYKKIAYDIFYQKNL